MFDVGADEDEGPAAPLVVVVVEDAEGVPARDGALRAMISNS